MSFQEQDDLPSLDAFREKVLRHLASLLESHVHSWVFGEEVGAFINRENRELDALLSQCGSAAGADGALAGAAHRCRDVRSALSLLVRERQRQWKENGDELRGLMLDFNRLVSELQQTLIDKDLLERQSQVLRNIILSHERITQWKEFVQEILSDFHKFFPFQLFFIAFTEEHGLSLNLYYMGEVGEETRHNARQRLSREMLARLGLPKDAMLDIEEFQVLEGHALDALDGVDLLTVAVPEALPNLEGVLGVGYASSEQMAAREQEIVRAILAVMVMVVGSSKALTRTMAELEYYSVHDPLTGLHNRRHFNDVLSDEIDRSARHQHPFVALSLDLDNFKDINDSFGHPCGDEVLKELGSILRSHLRKGDVVSRLGGDEFAILLPETQREGGMAVAEAIRNAVREARFHGPGGESFHVTLSIGMVCYPDDAESREDLLSGVDIALYQAKEQGKDKVSMAEALSQSLEISRRTRSHGERLRTALEDGRLVPYFHRIVSTRDGSLHAHEVLARLREEDGQIISAAMFIDIVEKYGFGWELDQSMVAQALAAKKQRLEQPDGQARLFINLSAQAIQSRGILNYAEETCRRLGVPAERVVFEILEREAIGDMTNMRRFLSELREKGFAFALDDFGSGYNSFHYLRELHFEYVKIDGAFVRNIVHSRVDHSLVKNLTRLCQDLGILTIAEFVESAEILDMVRDIGVDYVQGYHIALPRPAFD